MRLQPVAIASSLALVVVRCQCLVPVAEGPRDGAVGRDGGGADSGSTPIGDGGAADAASACAAPGDCGPTPSDRACPWSQDGGAMSCISGTCLWECQGPRTCTIGISSSCLNCNAPPGPLCPVRTCRPGRETCSIDNAGAGCRTVPGTSESMEGAKLAVEVTGDCARRVRIGETGVEMGWWYELDGAQAYGYFPGLGGWCTGIPMNSALPRYVWYCPTCQFATLGCCWVC